jgi:hypothetical protein
MTDTQVIALMAATIYAPVNGYHHMTERTAVERAVEIFVIAREAAENIHEQET